MNPHVRANLWLLLLTVLLCNVAYPVGLLVIGQTAFRDQAEGSLIYGADGQIVGSKLIAQPFTGAGDFHPRPSAVSYNAAASGASNWGASNYLLRERVARQLGPIVKYSGARSGEPVGPDIEAWFQQDQYQGQPGLVAQWAQAHPTLAVAWVKATPENSAYVTDWMQHHPEALAAANTQSPAQEKALPEDFAVPFFTSFAAAHPGKFPSPVASQAAAGPAVTEIRPVGQGTDIQGMFFDMWRNEHPDAELELVPADLVMSSGSGLDPHITLQNAVYQLDRVATQRAADTGREVTAVKQEIETLLRSRAQAPLGGLAGVPLVNVLEINLALREKYSTSPTAGH
ncbi:MAG: potassium-transporting ATPase subunit C [Planctomycetes bacterium]|nr:potassium-transporting ATPase subunit C [Planctomycetota bacterium]